MSISCLNLHLLFVFKYNIVEYNIVFTIAFNDEEEMDADMGPDIGGEEPVDVEPVEDEEETVDEAYGEKTGGNAASTSGKWGGSYGASGEDKGNAQLHEGFKSRMQKLANIRK